MPKKLTCYKKFFFRRTIVFNFFFNNQIIFNISSRWSLKESFDQQIIQSAISIKAALVLLSFKFKTSIKLARL